ncbi:hypothetical protein M6B38_375065 [Iris pallida]|uniref:Secreted protein n=1 Tax=Iris pallida TaxID=29817 RepID=A0AAX6GB20_IRIPA|nr:hypothetical protein M6B38_375065 [Iris pallida]
MLLNSLFTRLYAWVLVLIRSCCVVSCVANVCSSRSWLMDDGVQFVFVLHHVGLVLGIAELCSCICRSVIVSKFMLVSRLQSCPRVRPVPLYLCSMRCRN